MVYHINRQLIAHRGAAGYAPENTLASFNEALARGASFIEFDVMLSADNEAFVFHDENLKRTTNGRGEFGHVDAAYIKTLDAGKWFARRFKGEPVLTLIQALEWLAYTDINANIEIKPYPGMEQATLIKTLTLVHRHWPATKQLPLISSFHHELLALCHSISPDMPLGLLLDTWDENGLKVLTQLPCYSLHMNYRALTKKRVELIKQSNIKLFAYTVNRRRLARRLLDWGVDALFSDYPDLIA
ncbi:MAG: glycerophosphoryl diester phosphodiesterase [Legionellaceae bacterium]|nr:glycerophosphoryl diester phosphodiesterase [Legionellaceae bacterium]HCA88748.1 glycerophosphodiester phosphodiesterase [Legionellales bacterium]